MTDRKERTLTLYRDDTTAQVVFERVKTFFWVANNTVLVISRYDGETGPEHHYIHWPRERFCWFKDEPKRLLPSEKQTVEPPGTKPDPNMPPEGWSKP